MFISSQGHQLPSCLVRLLLLVMAAVFLRPAALPAAEPDAISNQTIRTPALPDPTVLRLWIEEMKEAPRGPFGKISWFCKDGTIHPAKPYPCGERGGGIQHGQWNDRIRLLRANGYLVGNVIAEIKPDEFILADDAPQALSQLLLERFLMQADRGWIFRKALTYRGALQQEDESAAGRSLLLALLGDKTWREDRFALLREAVRLLPRNRPGAETTLMRRLSTTLAEKDPKFNELRIKLHNNPSAEDAPAVRRHAKEVGVPELAGEYEELALTIDRVFTPPNLLDTLESLSSKVTSVRLKTELDLSIRALSGSSDPQTRYAALGHLLRVTRHQLPGAGSASRMLSLLELGLLAEQEMFALGSAWKQLSPGFSRRRSLELIRSGNEGLYGMGLLSARQMAALDENLNGLLGSPPRAEAYQSALLYQARVSSWAANTLHFNLSSAINRWAEVEPKARLYLSDRLRSSPLLGHMILLDALQNDAAKLMGISHRILGTDYASGIRGLNAGLARGPLLKEPLPGTHFAPEGIYILPETREELHAVAGIITGGSGGNLLSHTNLLARNLGVPNLAVAPPLLHRIEEMEGKTLVLAVSPGGRVLLEPDGPAWEGVFRQQKLQPDVRIRPDTDKLDLRRLDFIPLSNLGAGDSGRIVGPKGANLGELKKLFPEAVTEGLAIPFGHFRKLLDQPVEPGGISILDWMRRSYADLATEPSAETRKVKTTEFLKKLRRRIENADPGEAFRTRLKKQMEQTFGPEGSYGVFVRSDTNIEDLPGFTGAGLNLTLPNVVGFEAVLQAILRVWASPFTERAYSWRQQRMDTPEHVYASVLLLKSVPSEKSGVLVTRDLATDDASFLTIATSEGIGGAVMGQRAEELLVHRPTGRTIRLNEAAEPTQKTLSAQGGIESLPAAGARQVLSPQEIAALLNLADEVERRFPAPPDPQGKTQALDVEFGFVEGRLALFQIRPLAENQVARQSSFLRSLDQKDKTNIPPSVNLDALPEPAQ